MAAGRTDVGFMPNKCLHFDTEVSFVPKHLVHRLNSYLSDDIAIYQIGAVEDDFHARFDVTSRSYEYWITYHKNPFYAELSQIICASQSRL